jgi:hypothetical protein
MDRSGYIKDYVKRLLGMMVMILVFVLGITLLYFSSLLVGQQEMLKTTDGDILYSDEVKHSDEPATIVVENDENLKIRHIAPLSPVEDVKSL